MLINVLAERALAWGIIRGAVPQGLRWAVEQHSPFMGALDP